jgi:hypothetical protein
VEKVGGVEARAAGDERGPIRRWSFSAWARLPVLVKQAVGGLFALARFGFEKGG